MSVPLPCGSSPSNRLLVCISWHSVLTGGLLSTAFNRRHPSIQIVGLHPLDALVFAPATPLLCSPSPHHYPHSPRSLRSLLPNRIPRESGYGVRNRPPPRRLSTGPRTPAPARDPGCSLLRCRPGVPLPLPRSRKRSLAQGAWMTTAAAVPAARGPGGRRQSIRVILSHRSRPSPTVARECRWHWHVQRCSPRACGRVLRVLRPLLPTPSESQGPGAGPGRRPT